MASTKRRRRHARKKAALTDAQEMDLLLGGSAVETTERREAWLRHRDQIRESINFIPQAAIDFEPDARQVELGRLQAQVDKLQALADWLILNVGRTQSLTDIENCIARQLSKIEALKGTS